ncbi:MAG: DUF4422 domain-containing protein [Butyrivibrio sp.]|nr:DUF4422 domain-containing protein [Butyrivibrio sp.]MBR1642057.1 DUF4422 domain-containing protein [Butyrivibrio sp.]
MKIAIYGAQGIALGTYEALTAVSPDADIVCFVVTQYGNNAKMLAGLPVLELDAFAEKYAGEIADGEIKVIIATPEAVMDEIETGLADKGIANVERMTSARYSVLWKKYQGEKRDFLPIFSYSELAGNERPETVLIYMARFHKDKPLERAIEKQDYYREIQVGAAGTEECIKSMWSDREILKDNAGDNISGKNCNYSELTALFWVWKHVLSGADRGKDRRESYYGLCHYRRQLDILHVEIDELNKRNIDVVLPFPMPYEPDINAHHERYLSDSDWNAVLQALKELQPEYYRGASDVFSQRYLYNYNLILARRDVLADYCGWLFPVLLRVEELSVPKGSERSDRYIGYIAENLETLYFMKNRDKLRIAHTGCLFRK